MLFRTRRSRLAAAEQWPGDPSPEGSHELAVKEWRSAARDVLRAYRAWGASARRDSHSFYVAYLAALTAEEQAALRVAKWTAEAAELDPRARRV